MPRSSVRYVRSRAVRRRRRMLGTVAAAAVAVLLFVVTVQLAVIPRRVDAHAVGVPTSSQPSLSSSSALPVETSALQPSPTTTHSHTHSSAPAQRPNPATSAVPTGAAPARCPQAPDEVQRYAPGSGKTVALTFDDGPGRDTARVIQILQDAHVTATFFNIGGNEQNSPDLVRAEAHDGFALGDHTWDHGDLSRMNASAQANEMDRERNEQASLTGTMSCLVRPPGGSYTGTTLAVAQQRRLTVWNWSVDTEDWKANGSGAPYWVHRIVSRAEAGVDLDHPVILMHNQPRGNPASVAALPTIIEFYKSHGYRFVHL